MATDTQATLLWQGAAHYHIACGTRKIVIDPLYTRLPGEKPQLKATRDDLDHVDVLLLTHGHLDHSWDFPYLVVKLAPEVWAPAACLRDVEREAARRGAAFEASRYRCLEQVKGKTSDLGGITMTPYQIGSEELDFWFFRSMLVRPWRHGRPGAVPTGLRWLTHHVFGNCFAFHLHFAAEDTALLYFANLTDQVDELDAIERVDVLALPYCPANRKWLRHSQHLIERFRPGATLVHHFDNFMHPYTLPRYMNLEVYRRALRERCPDARITFAKFDQEVPLAALAAV